MTAEKRFCKNYPSSLPGGFCKPQSLAGLLYKKNEG
jgi:hypothetical protein